MHSKTAFFNVTILKKDLTRFLPLWAIYLILGLLLVVSNMGSLYYYDAEQLVNSLSGLSVVLCVYALIAAQLLFGDLFQGRMCNAVHALPVRREGLFFSHFAAGLIMGIGPNVLLALISMLSLGRLWFVALAWLGGMAMIYLLFFGIAVFCMLCSGNRFAGVALYGLINLLGVIVMWFFETFYIPMLYGIELTHAMRNIFFIFSPVVKLVEESDWITLKHAADCMVYHDVHGTGIVVDVYNCVYNVKGYGKIWGYLGIMVVVGLVFAAASLALYRKRHLESAGDFLSVKPMGILFTLVASACMGGLCYYIVGELFIGIAVGLVVGFFICKMLLERTIRVFGKKSWLQLIAFGLVVALSIGLTYFDAFGIAHRIPDAENVASVTIADRYISASQLNTLSIEEPQQEAGIVSVMADPYYSYGKEGMMTLTNQNDIDVIRQVHQLLLEEGDARKTNHYSYYETVTIHYVLKNGTAMTRYYYTATNSEAMRYLSDYTNTPRYLLGFETPEEMARLLKAAYIYDKENRDAVENPEWLEKLAEALFADAENGELIANGSQDGLFEIQLEYAYEDGRYGGQYLIIPQIATNTVLWLQEYDAWLKGNSTPT